MLNFTNFAYLLTIIPSLLISLYILWKKRDKTSIIFSLIALCIAQWVISNFVVDNTTNDSLAHIAIRMAIIGPAFIGPLFFNFAYLFPNSEHKFAYRKFLLTLLPAFIILPLVPSSLNISDVTFNSEGSVISYEVGILYAVFGIIISIYMLSAFYILIVKYRRSTGLARIQLWFLGISFALTFLIAILTTLVLPIVGVTGLSILGPASSLIFTSATSYILLKHRFLDLRVVTGRIVYYVLLASLAYISFYTIVNIELFLFDSLFSGGALTIGLVFAIAFTYLYNTVNNLVKEQVQLRIINPGYDPDKVAATFNDKMSGILEYEKGAELFLQTLNKTLRPSGASIIIKSFSRIPKLYSGNKFENISSTEMEFIFNIFKSLDSKTILYEYLSEERYVDQSDLSIRGKILPFMDKHKIRCIMTFVNKQNNELLGVTLIGPKDGDIPYGSQEVAMVRSLIERLSVTLARSFLYEEVKQFNLTLQKKVDEATKELALRNEQLGEQLRKERDMMDILGHELRTPLGTARNAIIMIDSMKKSGNMDESKYDKYMDIAVKNIRREKDLLETILQSARLENNRVQMNLEKVSIKDVIDDAVTAFKDQAEQKGLQLITEIQPQDAYVNVDRTAIQQVVDNLVNNAVKYTYEGSVKVVVQDEGSEYMRIKVIDTGEGIAKEDLPNIGKKFFRANTHLGSEGKIGDRKIVRPGGTGIGLYVIKGLLNQFGSELEIDSEFGKGSTFSFKLKKLNLDELEKPKDLSGNTEIEAYKEMKQRSTQRVESSQPPNRNVQGEKQPEQQLPVNQENNNTNVPQNSNSGSSEQGQ